jgi:hypothetical protein
MGMTLEVTEQGTLTLPAEVLSGAKPHARYLVEVLDSGLSVRPESPSSGSAGWDDWLDQWNSLAAEITAASVTGESAVHILSEMRR